MLNVQVQPRFNAPTKPPSPESLLEAWNQQHAVNADSNGSQVSMDDSLFTKHSMWFISEDDNQNKVLHGDNQDKEFVKPEPKYSHNDENKVSREQDWPTVDQIIQEIQDLPDDDEIKLGWQVLLNQKCEIPGSCDDFCPFPNELYSLLFLGRYNKNLGITRNIINWVIKIFKTLKNAGWMTNNYKIPSDGTEIENLWFHLPELPLSMFCILFGYFCTKFFFDVSCICFAHVTQHFSKFSVYFEI